MDRNEMVKRGVELYNEENFDEALDIFKRVWVEFSDELHFWDGYRLLRSLRSVNQTDENLENEVMERFGDEDQVKNTYSWLLYDRG